MRDHATESSRSGTFLKFSFFTVLCFVGLLVFSAVFSPLGYLTAAVGATAATAFSANLIALRIFERRPLLDAGLWWTRGSLRNAWRGVLIGGGSMLLVTGIPAALQMASLVRDPQGSASLLSALYLTVLLAFGAVSEELMFRGYPFQALARGFGSAAAIAITSLLFGLVHTGNLNFSALALANTIGFGVLLGIMTARTGALWLAIGFHFGWNWVPPLIGVSVSGFNMGVSGYTLRWSIPDLWSGGAYGPEGGLITSGIVVLLLVAASRLPLEKEAPAELPAAPQEDPGREG